MKKKNDLPSGGEPLPPSAKGEPRRLLTQVNHSLAALTFQRDYLELLLTSDQGPNPAALKAVQGMGLEIDRLVRIADHDAELITLHGGGFIPRIELVDLRPVLEQWALYAPQIQKLRRTELRVVIEAGQTVVATDSILFERILLELVSNALHAAGTDGLVELALRPAPEGVLLTVSDSGGGMSPELLSSALDTPLAGSTTDPRFWGGLGLGLSLCGAYARALELELRLENGPDGLVALLALPFSHPQCAPESLGSGKSGEVPRLLHYRTVILRELHNIRGLERATRSAPPDDDT